MKVAILLPTRGDRPDFLRQAKLMISRQTVKVDKLLIVSDAPVNEEKDITRRYRMGYDALRNQGFDCIFLWEDDDLYCSNYIETMLAAWEAAGKPDIFGTAYTIYYNIALCKWMVMNHPTRASAMNTLIKPDLPIVWPPDNEPYTDLALWKQLESKATFTPEKHIALGIKHGVGLCGGYQHTQRLERLRNDDADMQFLSSVVDAESLEFYKSMHKKLSNVPG